MDDPPPVKYSTAILDAHHLYGDKGVIRDCGNRFRYLFVNPPPEEYLTTILDVYHDYKLMVVIKKNELDNYPPNAYKIYQCVICLNNPSNILYNPCLHVCACSQCNDKGEFKKCPYCREKIKETITIKEKIEEIITIKIEISFLNKLLEWIVAVLQKTINTIL